MSNIIQVKSTHSVQETADRLHSIIEKKELKLFARINHAAGAASIGETLRPSELLIFGNPVIGTPLMQINPEVGVALPQKVLIHEDDNTHVWLSYQSPSCLLDEFQLQGGEAVIEKIQEALAGLSAMAAN